MAETIVKRHFPPSEFNHTKVQECLSPTCDGLLIIEGKTHEAFYRLPDGRIRMTRRNDPGLREGDIWACAKCMTKHEFYMEYVSGPGGRVALGTVRAHLPGAVQERDKGEPKPGEFVE